MKALFSLPLFIALFTASAAALPIQVQRPQVQPWNLDASGSGAGLGVYLSDVADLKGYGAVVQQVLPGSAAAEAGLKAQDVIRKWNGTRVESSYALVRMVNETPIGRVVKLGVLRGDDDVKIAVTLKAKAGAHLDPHRWVDPNPPRFFRERKPAPAQPVPVQPARPRLGIQLQDLNPQLARFFGVDEGQGGVLVASVFDGSAAEKSGLRAGDVITAVNGNPVSDASSLTARVNRAGDDISLTILRDKEKKTIDIDPVAKKPGKQPGKKKVPTAI